MKLKANGNGEFALHPAGVFPAVCVDVIDLGLVTEDVYGKMKTSPKLRIVWETEEMFVPGVRHTLSKRMTASLHPKSRLSQLLSGWRGRPVEPHEEIDMMDFIGVSASLYVEHTMGSGGEMVALIGMVLPATREVVPSGRYDPQAARRKIMERAGHQGGFSLPDCPLAISTNDPF